jgi:hypothetical protein
MEGVYKDERWGQEVEVLHVHERDEQKLDPAIYVKVFGIPVNINGKPPKERFQMRVMIANI